MPATDIDLTAHVSEASVAAIALLVEAEIAREHGQATLDDQPVDGVTEGAKMLLTASLQQDLYAPFIAAKGSDDGLASYALTVRRTLFDAALKARRCQCRELPQAGLFRGHGHRDMCDGHYEADVPPVDGLLLCGTCYGADPAVE